MRSNAVGSFGGDVNKFVDKTIERTNLVQRRTVLELGRRLILRTPVGNKELWARNVERAARGLAPLPKGYVGGHLRANWQFSVMTPAQGEIDSVDVSRPNREMANTVASLVPGEDKSVFITNCAPYADAVENGSSKQAPSGMVAITVAEFGAIVETVKRGAQ
jgi:hypothetical protein